MEFGKVTHLDRIQFTLPPDEERTLKILANQKKLSKTRFYLGAPVWACKEWVGKLYPPKTPPREFLKFYSDQFNSIELNSTFYRVPDIKTIQEWRKSTSDFFKFAPKVPQQVSHQGDPSILRKFFDAIVNFDDKLGMSFLQLPPSFGPERLSLLEKLLRAVPAGIELAVEFRHPGWFRRQSLQANLSSLLSNYKVATVITDVAGRRDVLHASLTLPKVIVRFVGNELHATDYSRADSWVNRINKWQQTGLEELYFFVHHPTTTLVPELADYVVKKLNQDCAAGLKEIQFLPMPLESGSEGESAQGRFGSELQLTLF